MFSVKNSSQTLKASTGAELDPATSHQSIQMMIDQVNTGTWSMFFRSDRN